MFLWKVQLILLTGHLQSPESKALEVGPVFCPVEGCSLLSPANQSPSGYNYFQLYFITDHLLSDGFLSKWKGINQKNKVPISGHWPLEKQPCSVYTSSLQFAQPDQRNIILQAQVNTGNQIVSSQLMAIEQPREPRALH